MSAHLNLVSWNINGLRAILKKDFAGILAEINADVLCLQEIKCNEETLPKMGEIETLYPHRFFNYAEKKGYSGTAILSKTLPKEVVYDIPGAPELSGEGRVITAVFEAYTLVTVYTPNSKDGLLRLPYRAGEWEPKFRAYLCQLAKTQNVVLCGDFNVAPNEIDLARPDANHKSPGFSPEERAQFAQLMEAGFTDTFRALYPKQADAYTWWSYRGGARARNVGWRIDGFVVNNPVMSAVKNATILADVLGSDHCPVGLHINPKKLPA